MLIILNPIIFIGTMWLSYFRSALRQDKPASDDALFTLIFNFYLVNYYRPSASMTSVGEGQKTSDTMTWHSE